MTQLAVTSQRLAGRHAEIDLLGELDIETAPRLRQTVAHLIQAGYVQLVIDMQGLDFLDSTGLSVLVSTLKNVHAQDGSLRLICNNPHTLQALRTTGLDKVFDISCPTDPLGPIVWPHGAASATENADPSPHNRSASAAHQTPA